MVWGGGKMEVIPRSHWPAITQRCRSLSYPDVVKSTSYIPINGTQIQFSVDYILKSVPISFAHKTTCCMLANVIQSSNAISYI